MPKHTNFLLGYGERLIEPVSHRGGPRDSTPPYEFAEALGRVSTFAAQIASAAQAIPSQACPADKAVCVLTLHPQFLAKSYYPGSLLRAAGFDQLGSKPCMVTPAKLSKDRPPKEMPSTRLFVSADREELAVLAQQMPYWSIESQPQGALNDLTKVEDLRLMTRGDRLKKITSTADDIPLELVIHASAETSQNYIIESLEAYLNGLGVKGYYERRFFVGGLCFLPVTAPRDVVDTIADFTFVRVVREMPRLRTVSPRTFPAASPRVIELPTEGPLNTDLKVAVFDGGLTTPSLLEKWTTLHTPPKVGAISPTHAEHGQHVTSAILFGPIVPNKKIQRPYAAVEHFRVLDTDSEQDPLELYDVLERIKNIIETRRFEFINLSIGPDLAIEDDDVHGWTSYLDQYLASGDTLAVIAAGNTGELDHGSGNARVQVPADCVNAIAVGAADSLGEEWKRAAYSSVGPGRRPGVVKPDLLAFGGSKEEPFHVVHHSDVAKSHPVVGTSFAGPAALRLAIGIRSHLGNVVWPLAVRALMIHCSSSKKENRQEFGWGRIPLDIEDILLCSDDTVRVLYQGELSPGEYRRAKIPVPAVPLLGNVQIAATFCYTCPVDPQDPGNYTRSGLEVVFRPNENDKEEDGLHPKSDSFFKLHKFSTERELRHDAQKWETTLHRVRSKRGAGLHNPTFDIHYNARAEGHDARSAAKPMRYALVVTVQSKRTADLYNQIVRRYRAQLEPLRPVLQIPLRAA